MTKYLKMFNGVTKASVSPSETPEEALSGGAVLGDAEEKKDTDRNVCESVHHAMKRWVPFNIRGIGHQTRRSVVSFRFNAVQILSSIFARYSSGATC